MIKCGCGLDSIWVENVPGKGYNYCRECKKEVPGEFQGVYYDLPDVSKTELIEVEKLFDDITEDLDYTFFSSIINQT